jgi:hypothetical protein
VFVGTPLAPRWGHHTGWGETGPVAIRTEPSYHRRATEFRNRSHRPTRIGQWAGAVVNDPRLGLISALRN